MQTFKDLFIGGEWVAPASSDVIEVISPATEEVIGQVPHTSTEDADRRRRRPQGVRRGPVAAHVAGRAGRGIGRLSASLQAAAQDIADTISSENGSPKQWSIMGQVFSSTMVLDSYVALATRYQWVDTRAG